MTAASESVAVRLHSELYAESAIRDAAATFEDFAKFEIRRDGEHFVVVATDIDPEADGDVVAEFCNFALANAAVVVKGEDA